MLLSIVYLLMASNLVSFVLIYLATKDSDYWYSQTKKLEKELIQNIYKYEDLIEQAVKESNNK